MEAQNEVLTKENYITNHNYMSFTRFSKMMDCEAAGLANYQFPATTATLVGSYVDSYFSQELDAFKQEHPEIFNSKTGALKADFVQAEDIIKRIESDETMMHFMSGEKQKIFTGVIGGVKFKAKIDSYKADEFIVDLKVMKDFEYVWTGSYKTNFVEAYNYDVELAIFQELVYQNTGKKLPCYICGITKETPSDVAIFQIPQKQLDEAMRIILNNMERFKLILEGQIAPHRCEKCAYCRGTKKARVFAYDLAGLTGDQLRENGIDCDDYDLQKERKEKIENANDSLEKSS